MSASILRRRRDAMIEGHRANERARPVDPRVDKDVDRGSVHLDHVTMLAQIRQPVGQG